MAAITAAKRQYTIFKVGKRCDRPPLYRNDLGHPAEIGIAHGDWSAAMAAPGIGLQIREICIPRNVDARRRIAGRSQQSLDLPLVAQEEYDLDGQMRFVMEILPHAFPDR